MPVTPFHFGPMLLLKGIAPRWTSLTAFAVSQAAIDAESASNMLLDRWPVHGPLHTFHYGVPLAAWAGLLTFVAIRYVAKRRSDQALWGLEGETGALPCLLGGMFGGASHVVLDAVMHADCTPFAPHSSANSLLRGLSLFELHALCVATGLAGLAALLLRGRAGR